MCSFIATEDLQNLPCLCIVQQIVWAGWDGAVSTLGRDVGHTEGLGRHILTIPEVPGKDTPQPCNAVKTEIINP